MVGRNAREKWAGAERAEFRPITTTLLAGAGSSTSAAGAAGSLTGRGMGWAGCTPGATVRRAGRVGNGTPFLASESTITWPEFRILIVSAFSSIWRTSTDPSLWPSVKVQERRELA